MVTWLWWQQQIEIGPVNKLKKSIENILINDKMTDDQGMTCYEILKGI